MTYVQLIEHGFVTVSKWEHTILPESKKSQHLKQPPPTIFSVQEDTFLQYFVVCMTSFSDDDGKEL